MLPAALDATAMSTVQPVCVVQRITLWAMPVAYTEEQAGWWRQGGVACVSYCMVQWRVASYRSGGLLQGGYSSPCPSGRCFPARRGTVGGVWWAFSRGRGGRVAAAPRLATGGGEAHCLGGPQGLGWR